MHGKHDPLIRVIYLESQVMTSGAKGMLSIEGVVSGVTTAGRLSTLGPEGSFGD